MRTTSVPVIGALAGLATSHSLSVRNTIPSDGFYPPAQNGGSMLTRVPDTFPAGQGEPINVIISALSDPGVLVDDSSTTSGGLWTYFLSLNFGVSCLGGINLGDKQSANLGDGNGYVNETVVMRYNYGDPVQGTCNETQLGGNHFRYWRQTGAQANSSAVFLAVSYELSLAENHDIMADGYNLGRDWLVGNATKNTFTEPNPLASQASSLSVAQIPNAVYTGQSSASNFTFQTTATYYTGLLSATSEGVNHNSSVPVDGRPAIDGLVAVLQVSYVSKPQSSTSPSAGVKMTAPQLGVSLLTIIISLLYSCI